MPAAKTAATGAAADHGRDHLMARKPAKRQCNLCGRFSPGEEKRCLYCGKPLVQKRWKMTPARIRLIHTVAYVRKGLRPEDYKARMLAITKRESSKDLKRGEFQRFLSDLLTLPDVPAANKRKVA